MHEKSLWQIHTERNPEHSQWYIQRFKTMREQGCDLAGEARLIDAIIPPHSTVLDAGSGPGRVGSYLHGAGHRLIGVDIDPELIAEAQRVCPEATWITADLTTLPEALETAGAPVTGFDAIVCAGNVMTFLAPGTRVPVLKNFRAVLGSTGRAVIGFGTKRGYELTAFLTDVEEAGLNVEQLHSSWDLRPLREDSDFVVAFLNR